MTKKEYLKQLKDNLSSLTEEESKKHIRTYRVKINTLVNSGLTEEEAIKKLGTPHKVATSIIKGKEKKQVKKKTTTSKRPVKTKNKTLNSNSKSSKKENKETLVQKQEKLTKLLHEKLESLKSNKKDDKKKDDSKNKKSTQNKIVNKSSKKKKDEQKETTNIVEESIIINEDKLVENTRDDKSFNIVLKQMINLICLLIVLAVVYYPFNLLNVYAIKIITSFELDMVIVYVFSVLIYLFYLIFCIVSVCHYLTYITDSKNISYFNVVSQKVKRICLYILIVPSMLLLVVLTMLFIMSCFFYLDGLRIKGIPIVCFGILIFAGILYTTLRNKILRKEKSIFYSFFTYIIPLVIVGGGLGSVYHDTKDYELVLDINSKYSMKTVEFEYELPDSEEFKVYFNTNYSTVPTFKEDKKLKDKVRIEVTYYKDYYELNNSYDSISAYISLGAGYRRKMSMFLENIHDNKIYSLNELERYEVIIYTNSKDSNRVIVEY